MHEYGLLCPLKKLKIETTRPKLGFVSASSTKPHLFNECQCCKDQTCEYHTSDHHEFLKSEVNLIYFATEKNVHETFSYRVYSNFENFQSKEYDYVKKTYSPYLASTTNSSHT